jgi:hypothetical protein
LEVTARKRQKKSKNRFAPKLLVRKEIKFDDVRQKEFYEKDL